jgi:hypothetical protein
MALAECPTCGTDWEWGGGRHGLYTCINDDCRQQGHMFCKECGSWNILITRCRCPYCEEDGRMKWPPGFLQTFREAVGAAGGAFSGGTAIVGFVLKPLIGWRLTTLFLLRA